MKPFLKQSPPTADRLSASLSLLACAFLASLITGQPVSAQDGTAVTSPSQAVSGSQASSSDPDPTRQPSANLPSAEGSDQPGTSGEDAGLFNEPLLAEDALFEPAYWTDLARTLVDQVIRYTPRLIAALILFLIFWGLSRLAASVLRKALSRSKADPAVKGILARLAAISILIVGLLMALSQAGLPVGSLLASVGVFGLAVGLAAQDSLSNVVAGLIILWDRPFRVGHNVTIADEYGTVTQVGLRTTTIKTVRDLEAILPNSEVISSKIINHTRTPALRIDVPIGIGYGEDIDAARQALLECVPNSDYASTQRDPMVVVHSLGDSSVNLELRVWLKQPADEMPALWHFTELAKKALDQACIEIPFPQRTLHLAPNADLPLSIDASSSTALNGDSTSA